MQNKFRDAILVVVTAIIVGGASLTLMLTSNLTTLSESGASQPARTADGKPDFSGIWQTQSTANWDLQAHSARPIVAQEGVNPSFPILAAPVVALGTIGWVPPGMGVVVGGEIPYQPWAAERKRDNAANWLDRDPEIKCYMPGVPRAMYLPYPFQIVQSTNKIMMVFEFANAQRTINLDTVDPYPGEAFMGYSVGRWEGDTLVVEVSNFTPYTWFDRSGNFHSDGLQVVERYTLISRDAIRYEATIEDSKVFTRPWTISVPLYRSVSGGKRRSMWRKVGAAVPVKDGTE